MTDDDIIRMADESGLDRCMYVDIELPRLREFARMVAEAEREACAALLDENAQRCGEESMMRLILETNAAAIRARTA